MPINETYILSLNQIVIYALKYFYLIIDELVLKIILILIQRSFLINKTNTILFKIYIIFLFFKSLVCSFINIQLFFQPKTNYFGSFENIQIDLLIINLFSCLLLIYLYIKIITNDYNYGKKIPKILYIAQKYFIVILISGLSILLFIERIVKLYNPIISVNSTIPFNSNIFMEMNVIIITLLSNISLIFYVYSNKMLNSYFLFYSVLLILQNLGCLCFYIMTNSSNTNIFKLSNFIITSVCNFITAGYILIIYFKYKNTLMTEIDGPLINTYVENQVRKNLEISSDDTFSSGSSNSNDLKANNNSYENLNLTKINSKNKSDTSISNTSNKNQVLDKLRFEKQLSRKTWVCKSAVNKHKQSENSDNTFYIID